MANLGVIPAGTVVTSEKIVSLNTSFIDTVMVGLDITAVSGTSPAMTAYLEVQGYDGQWYSVWTSSSLTATGQTIGTAGPGESNGAVFGADARLRLEVSGTSPSFTMSASVTGQ